MSILEISIILYLFIGFFFAGQWWEDTDNYYFIIRIFITALNVVILPTTLFLGLVWGFFKWCFNPLDNLFQISFYLSFYIFKRKEWRSVDKSTLDNITLICRDKSNTNSLKDVIYRNAAKKMFKVNNYNPDEKKEV